MGMKRKEITKQLINELKDKVNSIARNNPSEKTILRKINEIYHSNITKTSVSRETYLTIAAYLVVYRSLIINYRVV